MSIFKNYLLFLIILLNFALITKNKPQNTRLPDVQIIEDSSEINRKNKKIEEIFCDIKIKQGLFYFKGFIAYKKTKNFRMVVNSFFSKQLDVGSNDELFWFWSNNLKPKALYYCYHKDVKKSNLRDIFYPEILQSFLGIDEIKKEQVLHLGQSQLIKITTFDHEKVFGHYLYKNGVLAIKAEVVEFQKVDNFTLPKIIKINFLEENLDLEWILETIKLNNKYDDWNLPKYKEKINISYN